MTNYLSRVFYLGTKYHGSQCQPNLNTIQGELIEAVSMWSGETHSSKTVRLSGRTDKGVHSFGQLVEISTEKPLDIDRINRHLPVDIILWAFAESPLGFQPRFSALMRHYRYYPDDTWRDLDMESMRLAAERFIGCNDYRLVSKPDGNRNTVTTVLNMALIGGTEGLYLDIFGTSFLWKFVRKAATLLFRVGTGELDPSDVYRIIEGDCGALLGGIRPAPPEGLVLVETIVPTRFQESRQALRSIKALLENEISFCRRSMRTLRSAISLFSV